MRLFRFPLVLIVSLGVFAFSASGVEHKFRGVWVATARFHWSMNAPLRNQGGIDDLLKAGPYGEKAQLPPR